MFRRLSKWTQFLQSCLLHGKTIRRNFFTTSRTSLSSKFRNIFESRRNRGWEKKNYGYRNFQGQCGECKMQKKMGWQRKFFGFQKETGMEPWWSPSKPWWSKCIDKSGSSHITWDRVNSLSRHLGHRNLRFCRHQLRSDYASFCRALERSF